MLIFWETLRKKIGLCNRAQQRALHENLTKYQVYSSSCSRLLEEGVTTEGCIEVAHFWKKCFRRTGRLNPICPLKLSLLRTVVVVRFKVS